MSLQRQALEAAQEYIAEQRQHLIDCLTVGGDIATPNELDEGAWDDEDALLAQINAALAEPERVSDTEKKVFVGTLRWANNVLYAGKLKVGITWSTAAGQHGYFVPTGSGLGVGVSPPNIASEAEARAALEDAVLALGDSHGDAHDKQR